MIDIEPIENLGEELGILIDREFNEYAKDNGVSCDYRPFCFAAKEDGKVVGIINGNSYYDEVHIGDLIVLKDYRHKHIGSQLVRKVEETFTGKGFKKFNLSTYEFQAPEFYKKLGFKVEFVRENKDDPRLNKYFFAKEV